MKALLRLEGMLVLRVAGNPFFWIAVVGLGTLLLWPLVEGTRFGRVNLLTIFGMGVCPAFIAACVLSFATKEALRWRWPVRARTVLASHLALWGFAWLALLLLVFLRPGDDLASSGVPAIVNLFLLGGVVLPVCLVGGAASISGGLWPIRALAGLLLLGLPAIGTGMHGTFPGNTLRLTPWLLLGAIGSLALAFLLEGHREAVPAAGTGPVPVEGPEGSRGRPPWLALAMTAYGRPIGWIAGGVGGMAAIVVLASRVSVGFLLPSIEHPFLWFVLPSFMSHGWLPARRAWRHLMSGPVNRGRAFRVLYGPPIVMFALLAILLVAGGWSVAPPPVVEADWIENGPFEMAPVFRVQDGGLHLLRPTPAVPASEGPEALAGTIAEFVRLRYGARVDEARLRTAAEQAWGARSVDEWWPRDSKRADAVAHALDESLRPLLRWALRIRYLGDALLLMTVVLLALRGHLMGRALAPPLVALSSLVLLGIVGVLLGFFTGWVGDWLQFAVRSGLGAYAVFQDAWIPITAAWLLGMALLLRSCVSAFRRLDFEDLGRHGGSGLWG